LGSAVCGGRHNGLVRLRGHVLWNRAGHAGALWLLVVGLLGRLEARHVLELRVVEGCRGSRLERAAEEELGGEKGGELHVETGSRSRHVVLNRSSWGHRLGLVHGLSVELRDVATARVTVVSKTGHVGGESAMGEAGVAVGRLGCMAEAVSARGRVVGTLSMDAVEVLHVEQVRGDESVPPVVR
jgi:hypothetical protein